MLIHFVLLLGSDSPSPSQQQPSSKNAIGTPLTVALQLLLQPLHINQTLSWVLLHMDMLLQMPIVYQTVKLRSGLISEASSSLANHH